MSAIQEARLSQLDGVLDEQSVDGLAEELFGIVDTIEAQPSLRRALTDTTAADDARSQLARDVFEPTVSAQASRVLDAAVRLRWNTSGAFMSALERQAVRAVVVHAQRVGILDEVEDQLFRFARTVDANPDLRQMLANRQVPLAARRQLVSELVQGKVLPETALLAVRAVAASQRTYDLTVEYYLTVAAAQRNRAIALIEVARPLSADQTERLRAALTAQYGRPITLHVVVDPAVLGGVRVQIADQVIEGTVAGRLLDARRQLS